MKLTEIEQRLAALMKQFPGNVPPERLESFQSLVAAGEPGVALECYASNLDEYDTQAPPWVVRELETLADAMGMDEKAWALLER